MIELRRHYNPLDMGTFGVLAVYGLEFYTIELPWRKNRPNVSCVPEGLYRIQRGMFWGGDGPGGKPDYETFELIDVVGRTFIKFHRAQTVLDLHGCIGIGNALGVSMGRPAVLNSAEGHAQFMRTMKGRDEDQLRIFQYRP